MSSAPAPTNIFISYADADEKYRDELENHLTSLKHAGAVRTWHREHVQVGRARRAEIDAELESAQVILLLISADYLASEEYAHILLKDPLKLQHSEKRSIIPILVRPCHWEPSPIGGLNPLPRDGVSIASASNRDEAWRAVVQGVQEALAAQGAPGAGHPRAGLGGAPGRCASLYFHPLPSEPDFVGREGELAQLEALYQRDRSLVAAMIGIGGTGKSVLLQQFLRRVELAALQSSLFVWSFFVDQDADRFLKEAYRHVTGAASPATASLGHAYALADALRSAGRVVLALDGLERTQSGGGQSLGRIQDPSLRLLLELVAQGGCGRTFALVTSRFPLSDLYPFRREGYQELAVPPLEPEAAVKLLAARGAQGTENELRAVAERFGCHALTVSLVGSAIADFFDGDATQAPGIVELAEVDGLDQGMKLASVLEDYEKRLSPEATALLERMSAFVGGVRSSLLEDMFLGEGKESIAGPLAKLRPLQLRAALAQLEKLRLVERARRGGAGSPPAEPTFTLHAVIKEHFYRRLLGGDAGAVHAAIRRSLHAVPMEELPTTADELDFVEELIYHARKTGHIEEAYSMYVILLRSYEHLGEELGEYARGERILRGFLVDESVASRLKEAQRALATEDLGLFLAKLGDLEGAAACHIASGHALASGNLFKVQLLQGRLPEAKRLAEGLKRTARGSSAPLRAGETLARAPEGPHPYLGAACALLGEVDAARSAFVGAPFGVREGLAAVYYVDFLVRTGSLEEARELAEANLGSCEYLGSYDTAARYRLLLAQVSHLQGEVELAHEYLRDAHELAKRSGWQEALAGGHLVAARAHLAAGDTKACAVEVASGLRVAERCGFGLFQIDLLVVRAELELALDNLEAEATARRALSLASAEGCGYAWGEADAHDVLGRILSARRSVEGARSALRAALRLREKLGDPRLEATRRALLAL